MAPFCSGHASHPDWRMAFAMAAAQVDAQLDAHRADAGDGAAPTLGWCYLTDAYAPQADALLAALRERWPGTDWVGCVGVGVAASGVEYFDEPALVLLLSSLPRHGYRVFSGAQPLDGPGAFAAQVHADPGTPDVAELIQELAERTDSGYLFGGLAASRSRTVTLANGVWEGGLSGVAFGADVPLLSRVTQGSQPVGPMRHITAADRHVVLELDGQPALPLLLADLGIADLDNPRAVLPRLQATLVGLSAADEALIGRGGQFGTDTRVRHLIGLDPGRRAFAVADLVEPGMRLAFCQRDVAAARRDLVRICSEIREAVAETLPAETVPGSPPADPAQRILGAIYVSCSGRGGPHFGGPSAELQVLRHALGDVPLAGFFAGGEIARHHVYGYTGVLTVFVAAS
ncbi:MAG: FIST C-terminal domain-containing protein [Burkholderiaceae bacterium]|nr:FIST C-terminal domain-containing protein [Burkholderiaceae bacterium]